MIYFLYGEDEYRKNKALKDLLKNSDQMNTIGHTTFDFGKILADITTMPFLAERKTVILMNVLDAKNKENLSKIEELITKVPETTDLIFIETKFPPLNTRVAKRLKEIADVKEFNALKNAEIPNWIVQKTTELGGKINLTSANLLSFKAGDDLIALENEIKKLISFDTNITDETINQLTHTDFNESIFTLIDAIGAKNSRKSLSLLNEFLAEPDNETYVLSMISKQVHNMMAIKDLNERKMGEAQIVSETGLHPFVVKKTIASVKNFSFENLRKIHREILGIDEILKTGKGDVKVHLTKLLISSSK